VPLRSWNTQLAVTSGIERPSWLGGVGPLCVPWIRSFRGGLADSRVHDLILNVPVHRLISVIQGKAHTMQHSGLCTCFSCSWLAAHVVLGLLMERRVIVTSTSPSRLSSCVFGLLQLLFPLKWQHIFIPVLPPSMTACVAPPLPAVSSMTCCCRYVCAPMPFVVGVLSQSMPEVPSTSGAPVVHPHHPFSRARQVLSMPIEDVIVLDVDSGRVTIAGECSS
jgi:hypothetical protein